MCEIVMIEVNIVDMALMIEVWQWGVGLSRENRRIEE